MNAVLRGFTQDGFIWASGIENSFVPQYRSRQRPLDEYELMGHYEHWRSDLALVRQLGINTLRWGIPWHRVEPEAGRFDWSWGDQVLPYLVEELGVTPIVDLVHYGCPDWLTGSFADPRYPNAVAAYAAAFAERYSHLVHCYTPHNEPHMTALMGGQRGIWPPYLRGERGFLRIMVQVARGMQRTIRAIREIDPRAAMIQVEATALHRTAREELKAYAAEEHERRYLSFDLLAGHVSSAHPAYLWLVRNGIPPAVLRELVENAQEIDVMGLNFYPQWSTLEYYLGRSGHVRLRLSERDGAGFGELIEDHHSRYGVPIMITETSAYGSHETRSAWLESSVRAIRGLRESGVPVIGYTWFPLFTMVDWRYRFGTGPVEQYHIDLGLFTLGTNRAEWVPTPLAEQFAGYAAASSGVAGRPASSPAEESAEA